MDFVDWRKSANKQKLSIENEEDRLARRRNQRFSDYVEEIIVRAQERGEFSHLPGMGKPLKLLDESSAGDKAMAYHVLKQNGYAPMEIELAKEIRTEQERLDARIARVIQRGHALRSRRIPPFLSEKRAFNNTVEKVARDYEEALRRLNSRILTLNLTAPASMHQPMLDVEYLLKQFHEASPLFDQETHE